MAYMQTKISCHKHCISEDTGLDVELKLSMVLLFWSRCHRFYGQITANQHVEIHTRPYNSSRLLSPHRDTHTATGVLGVTITSLCLSLKFVLRKQRKVKTPSTVTEKANNAFKRVNTVYMSLA